MLGVLPRALGGAVLGVVLGGLLGGPLGGSLRKLGGLLGGTNGGMLNGSPLACCEARLPSGDTDKAPAVVSAAPAGGLQLGGACAVLGGAVVSCGGARRLSTAAGALLPSRPRPCCWYCG